MSDRELADTLAEALRLTRECAGAALLPAWPGWAWFEALTLWREARGLPPLPAETPVRAKGGAPGELYGLRVGPAPAGWEVDGVVALDLGTDRVGQARVFARTAGRVMLWQELGMLDNERAAVLRQLEDLPAPHDEPGPDGSFWADGKWWPRWAGTEPQDP